MATALPSAHEALAASSGGEAEDVPESLWEWLSTEAKANQSGIALIAAHQPPHLLSNLVPQEDRKTSYLSWTFRQLLEAVERLAAFFITQNVVAGDAIYTFLDNDNAAEWTLLFWTAARLGTVLVPMDPRALERAEEVESLSGSLVPSVTVVLDCSHAQAFDQFAVEKSKLKLMCNDGEGGVDWQSLGRIALISDVSIPDRRSNPGDLALVMCTSGSTSLPKGCEITVRGMIAQTRQYHSLHRIQLDHQTRHLATAAVFRPVCYLTCLNAWSAGGAAIFYGSNFDPRETFATLRDLQVTHAWFVPAMVHMLSTYFLREKVDVKMTETVKVVLTSGDTLDRSLVDAARGMFPAERTRFIPHWGMSEGAPVLGFVGGEGEKVEYNEMTGVAGVGRALSGTKLRIHQPGSFGQLVQRGEQGELHVCSVATIDRYLGGRATDDFYKNEEGTWFKTGDTAVMDKSGIVYIAGRTKDIIIALHMRHIIPSVLEGCLKGGFGVEVVVVGVKDDHHGNVATAVVRGRVDGEEKRKEMDEYVRSRLGDDQGFKGGVWTLEELAMDDWPYNTSKKIQKRDLVDAVKRLRKDRRRKEE